MKVKLFISFIALLLLSASAFAQSSVIVVASNADPTVTDGTITTTAGIVLAVNASRKVSLFRNNDAAIIMYVGPAGITSGTGFPVKPGETYGHNTTAALYAVAASGTPAYRTLTER